MDVGDINHNFSRSSSHANKQIHEIKGFQPLENVGHTVCQDPTKQGETWDP